MSALLTSSHQDLRSGRASRFVRTTKALEAGIESLRPDFAMSKLMDASGVLLALPDDKLVAVLDDLKLTATRLNKRIALIGGDDQ